MNLFNGDCRDLIRTLPSNSVDSIITDPPYALNKMTNSRENSVFNRILNVVFPNFNQLNSEFVKDVDLSGIPIDGSQLSRRKIGMIIESGIGVPKSTINLKGNTALGKHEVKDSTELPVSGIPDAVLMNKVDSDSAQFIGDFVLDTRDALDFTRSDVSGSDLAHFGLGFFSMPIVPTFLPGLASSFGGFGHSLLALFGIDVWPINNALGQSSSSSSVLTRAGAINCPMLRFNMRGPSCELVFTKRTLNDYGLIKERCPKLVRADSAASCLSADFKPLRVSFVIDSADGANSFYFHLWTSKNIWKQLSNIIPQKGFMGKDWDGYLPDVELWKECLRVIKPGGLLMAFGHARKYHRLACAIEDAGWEIRDCLMWIYGEGKPAGLDIGKAIDKELGAERKIIHTTYETGDGSRNSMGNFSEIIHTTVPATDEAQLWDGYHTGLKTSYEPICLAQKPIEGTYAQNALKHGVAGYNINECRIDTEESLARKNQDGDNAAAIREAQFGRWPANVILDDSQCVEDIFPHTSSGKPSKGNARVTSGIYGDFNERSLTGHNDSGSAKRFFYVAKASKYERELGLQGFTPTVVGDGRKKPIDNQFQRGKTSRRNTHVTVKPLLLMQYLCKLSKPPHGGIVLDPFMGSGTTGMACALTNRDFIGFELSEESFAIAQARIEYIQKRMAGDFSTQTEATIKPVNAPLFELMENET